MDLSAPDRLNGQVVFVNKGAAAAHFHIDIGWLKLRPHALFYEMAKMGK